jgi:CRP/FNR family transcriptional regulator, cyclic AMP receptor protein
MQRLQPKEVLSMIESDKPIIDPIATLSGVGLAHKVIQLGPKRAIFSQGDPADCVFYLQNGRARISVVSRAGKEAIIALLSSGDFVGEEMLSATAGLRLTTATTITACTALKIGREEMIRAMRIDPTFADFFLKFLLTRSMRTQADLVDQLFNSSEKRLARILLLMADYGNPENPVSAIPKISQETLAEMIGTTRSRVSYFMNRFRSLGFIEYSDHIQVNKSLLSLVLSDHLPDEDYSRSEISGVAMN